jgi:hypothetical protein
MIKAADRTGRSKTTKNPVPLSGYGYTLYLTVEARAEDGKLALSLSWEDEGEQHSQTIPIVRRESNLIQGSFVYYFLCPFGYKAKKLFYIGGRWRSRRSFHHRYSEQNLSRQQRERSRYSRKEPYRKNGKEYYRRKLTPYGKRCKRYEANLERGLRAFYALAGMDYKTNK